jgi:hypothetical protein
VAGLQLWPLSAAPYILEDIMLLLDLTLEELAVLRDFLGSLRVSDVPLESITPVYSTLQQIKQYLAAEEAR